MLDKSVQFRETRGPCVALDIWSTDAWKSTPFTGFRDLLREFETFEDWPSLADMEQRWLRPKDVRTHMGIPMGLMAQPAKLRRARPRSISQPYDIALCEGQVDAALKRMLSSPDFRILRDPRRAVALTDLYFDWEVRGG